MKRQNKILILVLVSVLVFSSIAHAQANKYYLNFWGAVGYANLLHEKVGQDDLRLVQPLGGVGGLLGLGFEYHYKRFMVNIGVEFDLKNSFHKFKPFITQVGTIVDANGNEIMFEDIANLPAGNTPRILNGTGMIDTDGDHFAMRYDFRSYSDTYTIGYLNVPLMLGAKYRTGLYFLAGGKFGLHMLGIAQTKAKYTTYGLYPQYMQPLQDMGEHFYDDFKTGNSNPVALDFNIVASLEVGKIMFFSTKRTRWHYRISGFIDYGIGSYLGMNPLPSDGQNVLTNVVSNGAFLGVNGINVADPSNTSVAIIQSNSMITSAQFINKKLNPLLIGVKLRLMFDLGNKEPCNCLEDFPSKWRKKNRIR